MATGTDVLTLSEFEKKIRYALEQRKVFFEDFELDGIKYHLRGLPCRRDTGEYYILWSRLDSGSSHNGQQTLIGYHDDYDFADHSNCSWCNPDNEAGFWYKAHKVWDKAMNQFKVTEWNPEIVF